MDNNLYEEARWTQAYLSLAGAAIRVLDPLEDADVGDKAHKHAKKALKHLDKLQFLLAQKLTELKTKEGTDATPG